MTCARRARCAARIRRPRAACWTRSTAVKEAGDSIGGCFVVVVDGLPIGLGSDAEWDTRLDGALAAAVMAIPAVKGVEIGLGFGVVERRGSEVHDVVLPGGPGGGDARTTQAGSRAA